VDARLAILASYNSSIEVPTYPLHNRDFRKLKAVLSQLARTPRLPPLNGFDCVLSHAERSACGDRSCRSFRRVSASPAANPR
jgi:hypothetical protein